MIKRSRFAFMAAFALATIASPAFAQTARTAPHRHIYSELIFSFPIEPSRCLFHSC